MQTLKYRLVEEGDTFSSVLKQYSMNEIDLKRLNPLIRGSNLIIGTLIYIFTEENKSKKIIKDQLYYNNIKDMNILLREYYVSLIFDYNDSYLLEQKLLNCYNVLSKQLLAKKNEQDIFVSFLNSLQVKMNNFIKSLKSKEEKQINTSKEEIKKCIKDISTFFIQNDINFSSKTISKIVENQLLIIAKIINNNLYDTWSIIDESISLY